MRLILITILLYGFAISQAQNYVLKDARPDSNANYQLLYDSLPMLCDSFYATFQKKELVGVKKYVPQVKFLKATFDTMAIEYRYEQVVYRQQLMLRNLQKDYRRILKKAEKTKLNLKRLEQVNTRYRYGIDDKENHYCYITVQCKKKKHEYQLKYLAIQLNGKWFVGDELSFEEL